MSDLETRLRDLAGLDTGRADPRALAAGARQQAVRNRRRTLAFGAFSVLAVLGVVLGFALGRGVGRATPAVPSTPRSAVDALCSLVDKAVLPRVGSDLQPAGMAEVALCPHDPNASAWLTRPTTTLSGPSVQFFRLGVNGGGPPVEQCPNKVDLPGFTYVVRTGDGALVKFEYRDPACPGLFSLQSYYMSLAEAEADRGASAADPEGVCPSITNVPRHLRSDDVVLCIHPVLSSSYAEPIPVFRPVKAVRLQGKDLSQVLAGLTKITTAGPADERECPYAKVDVVIWRGAAKESAQLLTCDWAGSTGSPQTATWKVFPLATQQVIDDAIRAAGYEPFAR